MAEGCLLAMDMGTGKSAVAATLAANFRVCRTLIVSPRSVVNGWPNQIGLYADNKYIHTLALSDRMTVVQKATAVQKFLAETPADEMAFVIVNYESAWRPPLGAVYDSRGNIVEPGVLMNAKFDLVIADEIQAIKGPESKVGRFMRALGQQAYYTLGLSGTPAPQGPLDWWGVFEFIDPKVFDCTFYAFRKRYAILKKVLINKGKPGQREIELIDGYQNLDDLERRIAPRTFSCKKRDVLPDLPPVMDVSRVGILSLKAQNAYYEMEKSLATQVGDGVLTAANSAVALLRLQQITSGYLPDPVTHEWHSVDTTKRDMFYEILDELPNREPIVVFCRFTHDLHVIRDVCEARGLRYGEVSGDRDDLTKNAKMPETVDVLGVQIQSGGVGVDLTRAAYAVYYSVGFSVKDYEQSRARLDRPGQTRPVTYIHLLAQGTVEDEVIYPALADGRDLIEAVLGRLARRNRR